MWMAFSIISGLLLIIVVMSLNIFWRKQAESRLKESENKYRNYIENSPNGVFVTDDKGKYMEVNTAACRLTGYSKNELLEMHVFDMINSGQREEGWRQFEKLLQTGYMRQEIQILKKNGTKAFLIMEAVQVEPDRYIGFSQDITERKKTEEVLKNRNELIEKILDNLPIGLAIHTIDTGEVVYINKACTDIYGWPKEDLATIDHFFMNVFSDEKNRNQMKERIFSDIRTKDPGKMRWEDIEITSRNGEKRIVTAINTPLYEQNLMISTVQDRTRTKQVEAKLRQAQKMQAIGTLAGGIAHDFNNILFPITGYTEMLLEDVEEGGEFHETLTKILKASDRAKDLVQQILDFRNTGEDQRMELKLQPLIKETIKLYIPSVPSRIKIKQNIDKTCGPVFADPSQVHQILTNLVSNALQAMEKKGELLEVALKEVVIESNDLAESLDLPVGKYARLTVSDTGHGMDRKIVKQIFDPYFTTRHAGDGTGMGLFLVYGIIQEYKGKITVYSEPGTGTRFHVYLPVMTYDTADIPVYDEEEPIPKGEGERILLVDDEATVTEMMTEMLKDIGYRPFPYVKSPLALDAFHHSPMDYDLVITDQAMPEISGAELIRKMREIRTRIPVILTTGFSEEITEDRAKEMGICAYIMKPVTKKTIARIIRDVLYSAKQP